MRSQRSDRSTSSPGSWITKADRARKARSDESRAAKAHLRGAHLHPQGRGRDVHHAATPAEEPRQLQEAADHLLSRSEADLFGEVSRTAHSDVARRLDHPLRRV